MVGRVAVAVHEHQPEPGTEERRLLERDEVAHHPRADQHHRDQRHHAEHAQFLAPVPSRRPHRGRHREQDEQDDPFRPRERGEREARRERGRPPQRRRLPEPVAREQREDDEEAVEGLEADHRVVRPQRRVHGGEDRGEDARAVAGDPAAEQPDQHDRDRAQHRGRQPVLDLCREPELGRDREEHREQRRVERGRLVAGRVSEHEERVVEPVPAREESTLQVVEPLVGQARPRDAVLDRTEDVVHTPREGAGEHEGEARVEPSGRHRHAVERYQRVFGVSVLA